MLMTETLIGDSLSGACAGALATAVIRKIADTTIWSGLISGVYSLRGSCE